MCAYVCVCVRCVFLGYWFIKHASILYYVQAIVCGHAAFVEAARRAGVKCPGCRTGMYPVMDG